jgi:multidrug transporter EmrE-like cation transporter
MEPSQTIPIALNLLAAVLGAVGQYLYKLGGLRMGTEPLYKNWPLFSGMVLFCVVMVLFVVAFRLGGRLSVVYPVYATTFIWGTLLAVGVDREPFHWIQMAGVAVILVGVTMVALGSPK